MMDVDSIVLFFAFIYASIFVAFGVASLFQSFIQQAVYFLPPGIILLYLAIRLMFI